eukprot:4891019-Pyramimonas_sp.AAC.1
MHFDPHFQSTPHAFRGPVEHPAEDSRCVMWMLAAGLHQRARLAKCASAGSARARTSQLTWT